MYLFVLCPPRHGSTVLYKLLWTSPNVSTFFGISRHVGEGQFVPGVEKFFVDRWSKRIDWAGVKKVWDKYWDQSKSVLCEKSPSNICRGKSIEKFFSQFAPTYFICMIRSPYARRNPERWIQGASYQRENMLGLKNVLRLTYEQLTNDLTGTIKRLLRFVPELERLKPNVKRVPGIFINDDRRNRRIKNMNAPDTAEEIRRKNHLFAQHSDLLDFHGYRLLDG